MIAMEDRNWYRVEDIINCQRVDDRNCDRGYICWRVEGKNCYRGYSCYKVEDRNC